MALFFGYVLFGIILGPMLRLIHPRLALSRQELIAALAVGFMGTAVPGIMGRLIATISAPHYIASPENQCHQGLGRPQR
jgi:hypothetical protein